MAGFDLYINHPTTLQLTCGHFHSSFLLGSVQLALPRIFVPFLHLTFILAIPIPQHPTPPVRTPALRRPTLIQQGPATEMIGIQDG